MKIAYYINDLSYGGAQTMLTNIISKLKDKHEIKVFVRDRQIGTSIEDALTSLGVSCEYLNICEADYSGSKLFHKVKSFITSEKALKEYAPDIVHSHLDTLYSPLYCIIHRCNFVFTVHSFPDRILNKRFKCFLSILKRIDRLYLVGCAKIVRDRTIELLGSEYFSISSFIYNPVLLDEYKVNEKNNPDPVFIHVGRMDPIKNQKLLIDAFELVSKKHSNAKLLMIGDGELFSELSRAVINKGLSENVSFLGNRKDIPQLLFNSDVFVLSSDSECCPMTILEAMAAGLPIISTDVGGVSEIVEDAGWLIPPGDKLALADCMLKIMDNQVDLDYYSLEAFKNSRKYDVSIIADQYDELYRYLLS